MTSVATEPVGRQAVTDRDPLEEATARLHRGLNITLDRWLQIAGVLLPGLGLFLIILGWYGAAHTTREWEQTPYLLSGGMLGIGLFFAGGFCYFAYWLTKLVDEARHQAAQAMDLGSQTLAALDRIERTLREGAASTADGARTRPRSRP